MLKLKQVKEALNTEHKYLGYKKKEYGADGKNIIRDEYSFEYEAHKFDYEERYGGMDMGSEYGIVFSVASLSDAKDVVYYKVPGWYQSHYGSELEWDGLFEVKQQKKTVTVWEEAK
jgi:hypothetical protein